MAFAASRLAAATDLPAGRRLAWRALAAVLVATAYFGAGKLGLSLAFLNASASPVWPPTGIAIGAAILLGPPAYVGIFLGAFFVNITTAGSVATSLAIASGNTLEAFVAAWLVGRYAGGMHAFGKLANVWRFMLFAGVIATAVSASVGVVTLVAAELTSFDAAPAVWLTWWLGDAIGALVIAPAILLWAAFPRVRMALPGAIEMAGLLILTTALGLVVFGGLGPIGGGIPIAFVTIPPAVWAAYRYSPREAASISLLLSALAVFGTIGGTGGAFAREDANSTLLVVQAFVGVLVLVTLPLAAVVTERRAAAGALALARGELEVRVEARTRELAEAVARFSQFSQNLPGLAWIKDVSGRYVFANASFADRLSLTPQDVVGKRDEDLFAAEIAREYAANDLEVLRSGSTLRTTERQFVAGETRFALVNKFIVPSAHETLVGGVAFDITDRIHAERAVRKSQEMLALAEKAARVGSLEWSMDEGRVAWSDELAAIFGLGGAAADATLEAVYARFHVDDRARARDAIQVAASRGGAFSFETRVMRSMGDVRVVLARGAVGAEQGGPRRLVASFQDVTEQREVEAGSRRQLVTRKLVSRLLRDLADAGSSTLSRRRLGRSLAAEVAGNDIATSLAALQDMGVGLIAVERAEAGRFTFRGRELLERSAVGAHPTCYIALGFLEAVAEQATGLKALGSETSCESKGDEACVFVVHSRSQ